MNECFQFMFDYTDLNDNQNTDNKRITEHWENVIDDSDNGLVQVALDGTNHVNPFPIEIIFPVKIEHKSD